MKKIRKKFKPLPGACFAIITDYVGLFFILSNCSIQSTFPLFCKFLVYVVFAMANNTTVQEPLPGASIQIVPLSQPCPVSLYSVFILLFINFFCIIFSSSKLQNFKLHFPFIDEVTEIFINSKFCEKCSSTDRRTGAKLYRPNLTAVDHSILRVRERVPIFANLPRWNCERGLVSEYLAK